MKVLTQPKVHFVRTATELYRTMTGTAFQSSLAFYGSTAIFIETLYFY
jgi:hypothetical protein